MCIVILGYFVKQPPGSYKYKSQKTQIKEHKTKLIIRWHFLTSSVAYTTGLSNNPFTQTLDLKERIPLRQEISAVKSYLSLWCHLSVKLTENSHRLFIFSCQSSLTQQAFLITALHGFHSKTLSEGEIADLLWSSQMISWAIIHSHGFYLSVCGDENPW